MTQPVILWFRNDLRLADHPALQAALETGQPVIPVYVLDDDVEWTPGAAARWWLHASLDALDAALKERGAGLVLQRGSTADVIVKLAAETHASSVFTGAGVEPAARRIEADIAERLGAQGVALHRSQTMLLFSPEQIRTKAGGAFMVYTPFANACLAAGDPPPPSPAPTRLPPVKLPRSDGLQAWSLLPHHPDWAAGFRDSWKPGEAEALARLSSFGRSAISDYARRRDEPGVDGTSMLSPRLHHGELSPRQVWHTARPGNDKFIRELLWREFNQHLLWHHPEMPERPLHEQFGGMTVRNDKADLRAWQRGRTGIPIVDAGMRQLWQIGWMHNRVRLIASSFLVKHLLLPWQEGERWFWDTLVDADLGNNAANWQWIAGCGADAAPFFRIFNPVLQGRKFDPDGDYVRRYLPELGRLGNRWIHTPWEAPATALTEAGVTLGTTYPHPIVDLAEGRARALAALKSIKAR